MKNTSAQAFVGHWVASARKGLLALSTSNSISAACRAVLKVQEGWEQLDIRKLDVEAAIRKFRSVRQDLKPASIEEYSTRFRRAAASYLEYLRAPEAWKYPGRGGARKPRASKVSRAPQAPKSPPGRTPQKPSGSKGGPGRRRVAARVPAARSPAASGKPEPSDSQEYMYPFRQDAMARLTIPRDATTAEINRLAAWARTLATDYKPVS